MINFCTGPRNRAPLGMKTTNAKTKVFQTPAGPAPEKELEKTASKQTSARRPKPKVSEKVKLDVHGDESPLRDIEVEYMPPRSKDLPYDSDVFPTGCLNYDMLKPENLTKGSLGDYYNTNDKSGRSKLERDLEKSSVERAKKMDEQILASMEEDWTVGDVPATFRNLRKRAPAQKAKTAIPKEQKLKIAIPSRGIATITSRRAASALSTLPITIEPSKRPSTAIPRPASSFLTRRKPPHFAPGTNTSMRAAAAEVNSRSTLGYTKGRSASNVLQKKDAPPLTLEKNATSTLPRSTSNISYDSNSTITQARFTQKVNLRDPEHRKPDFLRAFDVDVDDENLEPALKRGLPECSIKFDEDEEEFVLTIGDDE